MKLHIWWRLDNDGTWFPFRITDNLTRWIGSTFSDNDRVTCEDIQEPASIGSQQSKEKEIDERSS